MLSERVSSSLPDRSSFLRGYADYASQCSDAPDIYHVGVGLTILAGAVAKKLACPFMAGRILVPNLYTLLVGPSRSSRKTGSMDMGIDILSKASPEAVIPIPGSYEELVTQIRSTPSGLLTYREFGHFLKTTVRGYGEPIRTVLMDLYDWPADRTYTRNLKKGKTVIEPPICLSMLSACSTDLLYSYCVDEQTEILTAAGWKRYNEVSVGTECYTLNHETGLGEWQQISRVNVFEGQPQRPMIHMEGVGHSSLSTLNHRWPVRAKGNSTWTRRWKTSETLNQSDHVQCAARDNGLPTTPTWSDAFVELVGWAWTEGHWHTSDMLFLCQSGKVNAAYCERIRKALTAHIGPRHEGSMWPHRNEHKPLWIEDTSRDDGLIQWRLNQEASRQFATIVSIPEKVVSLPWLRTLTQRQLDLFIETSMIADGDATKGRLAQKSQARAEAFAFACILAGRPVSYCDVDNQHNQMYEIGLIKREQFCPIGNADNSDNRPFRVERVFHAGLVWCPTTPNGSWLARRNGSVYWTGNTDVEEWTGGFFGRMLLLYGEREGFRMPLVWDSAAAQLSTMLYTWANAAIPRCGGFSPDAWNAFSTWSQWRDSQAALAPNRVQTHVAGASTLAAKVALLYACDSCEPAAGDGWLISYDSVRKAAAFVEQLYLPSIFTLGERLALGVWEKDRQRVLDVVDAAPDRAKGIARRDLLRRVKMSSQLLDEVLTTLKEEGTLMQATEARGPVYKRAPEAQIIPFPHGGGHNATSQQTGS